MRRKLLVLPWLLYSGLIYIVSSHPLDRLPKFTIFGWDKLIHMAEFALYSFLTGIALKAFDTEKSKMHLLFTALVITMLYGASDEIHQYFVPGRSCSIFDFIADSIGGIIGLIFFHILKISDKLDHAEFNKVKNN